jgi:ArsR family transcriptional regulator, arsenate/arsenite/antimonite-responsive transcriptional repressor
MKLRSTKKPSPRRQAPAAAQEPLPADAELARLAKALGHPVRVAILRHLLRHGVCVCGALVQRVPLAQSTVSQHLKVLKEAGLLQGEIDGPRVCYCANRNAVRRLLQLIGEL